MSGFGRKTKKTEKEKEKRSLSPSPLCRLWAPCWLLHRLRFVEYSVHEGLAVVAECECRADLHLWPLSKWRFIEWSVHEARSIEAVHQFSKRKGSTSVDQSVHILSLRRHKKREKKKNQGIFWSDIFSSSTAMLCCFYRNSKVVEPEVAFFLWWTGDLFYPWLYSAAILRFRSNSSIHVLGIDWFRRDNFSHFQSTTSSGALWCVFFLCFDTDDTLRN